MATEYSDWFDAIRNEGYYVNGGRPVFEAYLSGTVTPEEAATQMTLRDPSRKLPAHTKIGRVWNLLLFCAEDCPSGYGTIIDLLRAISVLPKTTERGAVDWTDNDARTAWGWLWRDSHDSLWSDTISKSRADRGLATIPLSQKWSNFQAFSAACVTAKIMGMDNEVFFALILIVNVLEKERTVAELEMNAPAVAQWLLLAGKSIFNQKAEKCENADCAWDRESELWKGKRGYSRERWIFWKERWVVLAGMDGLCEEMRETCRKVVVAMGKVERAKK
ncbi:uncharacterized protein PAC_05709 [Phialocephala subalpina]|uniref:Uncharacterized protein n=1 Tax=Phialocephala subalpina TaxID=576137 RepID=A0A1L7WSS3_9HELO|nr:uncharacterized protein PAC_05709 [Phialocephala subalpina]